MTSLMLFFQQVTENPFIQHAALALLVLAPLCAMLGVQVVNFRMAFFSDAISHSAFSGIALGVMFHVDPRLAIVVFGLLVGLSITYVRRGTLLPLDTIIGVFNSAIIAFGVAVVSAKQGSVRDFQSFLYGDILSITANEIVVLVVILLSVIAYNLFSFNRLLALSLHEELAATEGISVRLNTYVVNLLLALVVAFGIRAVGILLITALLIVPAAAARNIARNVRQMFWWNMLISLSSAFLGLLLSLRYDSAAGATIILVATGWFLVTMILSRIVR